MQPEHALAGRRVSGPIFPYSNCRTTVPELILERAGFVSRIRFTQTERYGMRETQDRACEAARPPQPPRLSPSPFRSCRGDTIVCDGSKAVLSGSIAAVRAQRAGTKTPGRNAGSIGALPARRLTRRLTKRLCPAFVTSGPAPCAPAMVVPCRNENGRRDGYRAGHSC